MLRFNRVNLNHRDRTGLKVRVKVLELGGVHWDVVRSVFVIFFLSLRLLNWSGSVKAGVALSRDSIRIRVFSTHKSVSTCRNDKPEEGKGHKLG